MLQMRVSMTAGALATLLPLLSAAQTSAQMPAPTPDLAPRFFVGAGGSFGGYPLPERAGINVRSFVPTLGVQLKPRLAVQVSGAYTPEPAATTYEYDPAYPTFATTERRRRTHTLVVPVLARYTLTCQLAHRFQADALGGFSFVHFNVLSDVYPLDANLMPLPPAQESHSTTSACATLGAGVRFALCPRFEITGEAVLNHQLTSRTIGQYWANPNLSAGLRYRFGPRG
jgi:hypothetical protein